MGKVLDYNLAALQVTIGSFRVQGWGESDAISLARLADLAERTVSGDGKHNVFSAINDRGVEITFTLSWGTMGSKLLLEKAQEQIEEAKEGEISALAFQVYDPVTGYKLVERQLRFTRLPDISLGTAPGELEIKAIAPDPVETFGANITAA